MVDYQWSVSTKGADGVASPYAENFVFTVQEAPGSSGSATLTGLGSITAIGTAHLRGTMSASSDASIIVDGHVTTISSAALSANAAVSVSAEPGVSTISGSAATSSGASVVATGFVESSFNASVSATAALAADGMVGRFGAAALVSSSTMSVSSLSSDLPGGYMYTTGWSQPAVVTTAAPTTYGEVSISSSAIMVSAGIVVINLTGSATLNGTATLEADFRPYYVYNVALPYNNTLDYEALTNKPVDIDIQTAPSTARGLLLTPYDPDTDIVPSQARGVDISIESNNYFDMVTETSIQNALQVRESITDYEGISVPYDNNGEYNLGPYEPVVGLSPRSYLDSAPSYSALSSLNVEAIIEGYITTIISSEAPATELEVVTNNTLDVAVSSSTTSTKSVDVVVDHAETINLAASTSQTADFELVTNNNIDIEIQPSESVTQSMYGGPQQDRSIDLVIQPSTFTMTTLDWGQGQTIEVLTVDSTSNTLSFDLYVEKSITIDTFIQPSFTDPKRLASVGSLQDTLKGKVALARRTRAFAMR